MTGLTAEARVKGLFDLVDILKVLPSLDELEAVRDLVQQALEADDLKDKIHFGMLAIEALADLTPFEEDDEVAAYIHKILHTPVVDVIVDIVDKMMQDDDGTDGEKVIVQTAALPAGVPIGLIIQIALLLVKLLKR